MECEYCKNPFKTSSSLNYHKTHAKYCLKKQNKINVEMKCEYCQKSLSSKHWLTLHQNKCTYNIDNIKKLNKFLLDENRELKIINDMLESQQNEQIVRYEQQIKELQDRLENVAIKAVQRPTTRNTHINNYIHNMKPLTQEHLIGSVPNLTIDHIIKGPEGYAEYALEYPLKDRMVCSDYSRRKVKFKDKDGKVITDPEMSTLAVKFFESIKEKNKELIRKYANEAKEKLGDDNVMDTVVKLFDYKADVEKGSDGDQKTDFHHDFVRQMCSHTIKE
jgi:hypothetical protein